MSLLYFHVQLVETQLGSLTSLFTSVGSLAGVVRDNPLSASRWPALSQELMIWQPITGHVIFMNENKAARLSKVFGEEEQTSRLLLSFIQIQGIFPTFYGVWCAAVTPSSAQLTIKKS